MALPQGHRLADLPEIPLGTLEHEDFAMFSRRLSPVYFDHVVAACRAHGFSPRILHEVRSVTSQIAFVGCGQGIALVPSTFERLAPGNVIFRPLKERVDIVAAALAWSTARHNPLVHTVVELVRSGARAPAAENE